MAPGFFRRRNTQSSVVSSQRPSSEAQSTQYSELSFSTSSLPVLPPQGILINSRPPSSQRQQHSPSGQSATDSGCFSDVSFHVFERGELERQSYGLVKELRTLTRLTENFCRDAVTRREMSAELLAEQELKIRPYLIRLDEDLGQQLDLLRRNLDHCKVLDARVNWLLHYNRFTTEFRRIVELLTTQVYDELEKVLRLQARGCGGVCMKAGIDETLTAVLKSLDTIEHTIPMMEC